MEKITPALVARLAADIGCPPDWITVEAVPTRYLTQPPLAFAEVLWFERGEAVRDRVAAGVCALFAQAGHTSPTLRFVPIAPGDYYEDGRHF